MKIQVKKFSLTRQIPMLLVAWLAGVALEYYLIPKDVRALSGLEGISQVSGAGVVFVTVLLMTVLNLAAGRMRKEFVIRWLLVDVFALYATSAVINSFTWPFFGACLLVMGLLIVYAVYGWDGSEPRTAVSKESRLWLIVPAAAGLWFFRLVAVWTVNRIRCFSAPTFDFGIFAQMFHYMKTTGLPMTTVERDGLMSHFAIHVSPIYYLMLPFYCLVPRPETLQVLQAAVMASAVIPLWMLGRRHGLHPALRSAVCVLLLLYPAYAGGASFDLHENCFLTPLLLWLFYGIHRKSIPVTAVSALLTLMVKEDAPVYVAVIALYLLLCSGLHRDKWGLFAGGALLAGSVGYFLAVTAYLSGSGEGVMNWRYQNFMKTDSESLFTVIKVVLLCPMKAVFECVDDQKLKYIGLTLLPLACLPLMTRRYERFVLLIPYVLVNLMSDYTYQHDIMYQYSFGSAAFLLYLVVVNLADLKADWKIFGVVGLALCISFGSFHEEILPTAQRYQTYWAENSQRYEAQRAQLDTIPADASVAATTFYTTYLSRRAQLCDVRYGSIEHVLQCDYVVLKISDTGAFEQYKTEEASGKDNLVSILLANGYHLENRPGGEVEIFKR